MKKRQRELCDIYKPQTLDDCVLPKHLKTQMAGWVDNQFIPNITLAGAAGRGKTSTANILVAAVDADVLIIAAGLNNGVEMVRNKLVTFSSTATMMGGQKIVIIDEADALSDSAQLAMRNVLDEFADNCSYILTCNYPQQLIEPLKSRCPVVDYDFDANDDFIRQQIHNRCQHIIANESINTDGLDTTKFIDDLIEICGSDLRSIIKQIDGCSASGYIDRSAIQSSESEQIDLLMTHIIDKNVAGVRNTIINLPPSLTLDVIITALLRRIWGSVNPLDYPAAVLILDTYSTRSNTPLSKQALCFSLFDIRWGDII